MCLTTPLDIFEYAFNESSNEKASLLFITTWNIRDCFYVAISTYLLWCHKIFHPWANILLLQIRYVKMVILYFFIWYSLNMILAVPHHVASCLHNTRKMCMRIKISRVRLKVSLLFWLGDKKYDSQRNFILLRTTIRSSSAYEIISK